MWNTNVKTQETRQKKVSIDKEGYTDSKDVPQLTKLEYELEDFGTSAQQTIGSIFGKRAPTVRKTNIKNIDEL